MPSPRPTPKRAISLTIDQFNPAEQRLLRAAFHAFQKFVIVAGVDDLDPRVLAIGHPDGLAKPSDYPPGARVYALIRIRGIDKPAEQMVTKAGNK